MTKYKIQDHFLQINHFEVFQMFGNMIGLSEYWGSGMDVKS